MQSIFFRHSCVLTTVLSAAVLLPDSIQASDSPITQWVRLSSGTASDLNAIGVTAGKTLNYGAFVWIEVSDVDLGRLRSAGLEYEERPDFYTLRLAGLAFDPVAAPPELPLGWDAVPGDAPDLQLVQFIGPTRDEWIADLEQRDIKVVQYIHPNTYVVWARRDALPKGDAAPHVRWTGAFAPGFRANPAWVDTIRDPRPFWVVFYRGADVAAAVSAMQGSGIQVTRGSVLDASLEIIGATVSGEKIQDLAKISGVYSIQPVPTVKLLGERSDQVCANNVVNGFADPGYSAWLTSVGLNGNGVKMADVDDGIQDTHPDLANRLIPCTGTTCGGSVYNNHGTFTAGVMAADGSSGVRDANGFLLGLGVAPGASLIEQLIPPNHTELAILTTTADSSRNGAVLSNNSWGWADPTQGGEATCGYDVGTRAVDIAVRDADPSLAGNQPLTYVQAVGNGGAFGPSTQGAPAEAKNAFVVGATEVRFYEGQDNNNVCGVSSIGPACDGRTTPHIVAPGCAVDSAWAGLFEYSGYPCNGQPYCNDSGTSYATPHVSGAVGLFVEYWRKLPGMSGDPSPALIKASFTAVAQDLWGWHHGSGGVLGHRPDSQQGWGRLNLPPVVDPQVPVMYFDNPLILNATGEQWTKRVAPSDPNKDVRIMLAWTDAPGHGLGTCYPQSVCHEGSCCTVQGSHNSDPAWVNDLDLVVEQGAAVYRGNRFGSNGWSKAGGRADFRNNMEGVFLAPPSGAVSLTVKVVAANIAGDGVPNQGDTTDQDFALVCYNCGPDCNGDGIDDSQDITGGTSSDCNANNVPDECEAGYPFPAQLVSSNPVHSHSWWRSQNNIARFTFACNVNAPASGQVKVQELLDGGQFGADLSGSFTFTIEQPTPGRPRVLKIKGEPDPTLTHQKWYAVRNTGAWSGVAPFTLHFVNMIGDATDDNNVLNVDLGKINARVPTLNAEDDAREDINGDGRILNADVLWANTYIPTSAPPKPTGH